MDNSLFIPRVVCAIAEELEMQTCLSHSFNLVHQNQAREGESMILKWITMKGRNTKQLGSQKMRLYCTQKNDNVIYRQSILFYYH
jgi:hypothetical protein